ncbi:hypothetical protein LGQ02_07795 [Bacillus shivajii]|uniref:hypothetical protein n=1 Tax=Bacillus shivajii TaxID=1983719 RepID=UPI001CFC3CA6|nr:hypothetical protein [Bacillus shivajii]UCZ54643.1 hypothetical protein LGQ02_07795 [Bacillus shivajii]
MEIQGQTTNIQSNNQGRPLQLREGDVYKAKIESRTSDREAVISIRGQEVKAKFEGRVPQGDRVTVQVEGRTEDGVRVRAIEADTRQSQGESRSSGSREQQASTRVLRQFGHREPSPELRQSIQRMLDRGVPLTRESINEMNRYLQSGAGTERQRTQTLHMMAQKRVEPTSNQIRAVHEALHGQRSTDHLKNLTQNTTPRSVDREGQVRQEMANAIREPSSASNRDLSSREAIIRAVEQVRTSLQTGQNLRQSIEQLQQVTQRSGDSTLQQTVNNALREMLQIQAKSGRNAASERVAALIHQLSSSQSQGLTGASMTTQLPGGNNQSASLIENWSVLVRNEANLMSALETIRNELSQAALPEDTVNRLQGSLNDAMNRLESGRELKARQIVIDSLQQAEQTIQRSEQATAASDTRLEMQQYMRNEIMQTTGISSKSVLVTEVTERLATATDSFKAFQRDVSKQLSRIETMIQQFRQHAVQQTKPMLENVIKQLDRAIMKNDWMLFADMKTERKMLGASSKLADAKKLLSKGRHDEARQIVREVQRTMDGIQFRPSNQRVQHFMTQEQGWREQSPSAHRLSHQFDHTARTLANNEGSVRQVFEGVRSMGLTREAEIAQFLSAGKDVPQDVNQRNMKSLLLQMARGEEENVRGQQQQAQQALQNLSGQQLMNRNDPQQNLQMHMLQLPLMLKDEAENLQVFVNSRNEGDKVDWENCSLYFHIDTKKLGPLGIALNVSDRSLSVTLKNDKVNHSNEIEALVSKYVDNLKDVGYKVSGIKFSPMTSREDEVVSNSHNESVNDNADLQPVMTEKGFDFKI